MSTDDKIVFTAIFVGLVLIVLVLGLSTEGDAAEVKAVRSPIHAQYIGAWVRLSNDTPSPEIIITPTFDLQEEQQEDVTETNVGNIEPDPQDVEYLAIVIFCEAGADAQSDETRYMVGDVVLNRVEDDRFPDSIYSVLTQRAQYGRFYWTGIVWSPRAENASEANAVSRARDIAEDLLRGNHSRLYGEGYVWQSEHKQSQDSFKQDGIWFGR